MINESWAHKDITNAYLHVNGYELSAQKDRINTIIHDIDTAVDVVHYIFIKFSDVTMR